MKDYVTDQQKVSTLFNSMNSNMDSLKDRVDVIADVYHQIKTKHLLVRASANASKNSAQHTLPKAPESEFEINQVIREYES